MSVNRGPSRAKARDGAGLDPEVAWNFFLSFHRCGCTDAGAERCGNKDQPCSCPCHLEFAQIRERAQTL
jgi:hypothetical protein